MKMPKRTFEPKILKIANESPCCSDQAALMWQSKGGKRRLDSIKQSTPEVSNLSRLSLSKLRLQMPVWENPSHMCFIGPQNSKGNKVIYF